MNEQNQTQRQVRYEIEIGNEIEICSIDEKATIKDIKCYIGVTRHIPINDLVILKEIGDDLKVLGDEEIPLTIDFGDEADSMCELKVNLRCLVIKESPSRPFAYEKEKTFIFPQIKVVPNHGP